MKSVFHSLWLLCILCAGTASAFSLDREAFTFTRYDLTVRIEPEQHRLGVRGKITLRNDSLSPQKITVLQVSSSLDWRSIQSGGKPLQFVSQPYTSDIDHTGALSEAVITLPEAIAPKATIELEIAYEGVIVQDATRLTRIGTPEASANTSDWDQISEAFTAVRGVGYVTWYPIAAEAVDLSDAHSMTETVGQWKKHQAETQMSLTFESTENSKLLFSSDAESAGSADRNDASKSGQFSMTRVGGNVPTFVLGDLGEVSAKEGSVVYFPAGKEAIATPYAEFLNTTDPFPSARGPRRLRVVALPDHDAAPFSAEGILLMPLKATFTEEDKLTLIYARAREEINASQPWIVEGLAHFAQVREIEQVHGRKAALDYLGAHRAGLVESEKGLDSASERHPLSEMSDEIYLQSKAAWAWWMLYDMMGDGKLNAVLHSYEPPDPGDLKFAQKLIEKTTERDLQWFFDDWVYNDRGLPDFKVSSAFSRKTPSEAYLVTITVDNLGGAGAEVPVMVKFAGGELTRRLEVHSRDKAVVRVEVPKEPQEIVVNDGSVPESDMTNNAFKITGSDSH